VDRWIVSKLEADVGAGGLFHPGTAVGQQARISDTHAEVIPAGQVLPAIRISQMAGVDVTGPGGMRSMINGLWLVAVVGKLPSYGPLAPAANRIDVVLHKAAGTLSPIIVLGCVREQTFRLAEDEGDEHWRHLGALFRIHAQEE
jgi:hypothetical protein